MEELSELIAKARAVATEAHAGQVDKAGAPYISHPGRVAGHVRALFPQAPDEAVAVAWLHDTVEDTGLTLDGLLALGFPESVVAGVDAMTKRKDEIADVYFGRVRADPLAVMVKKADLRDNTDPERVALLDAATAARLARKYEESERLLQVSS